MEYIYAALLLHNAGKAITEEAITAVLQAAGIEVNEAGAKALSQPLKAWTSKKLSQRQHLQPLQQQPHPQAAPAAAEAPAEEPEEEEDHAEEDDGRTRSPFRIISNLSSPQGGLSFLLQNFAIIVTH